MSVLRKRLFVWFGILLAAGFIGLNLLAWNHAWAMLHYASGGNPTAKPEAMSPLRKVAVLFTGINVPRPFDPKTPADIPLPFERIRIDTPGGIRLGAWYCPGSNTRVLAILFHGWKLDKASLLAEAAAFHELGYPCLLVDFRGSGESSDSYTTIGYEEGSDVAAAFRYALARFPAARLALFGQSMGAAAILRAIRAEGVRPDAIILEAVFDSMLQTAKNRFDVMGVPSFPNAQLLVFWGGRQFGFNGFAHNPADYARAVACPALFLQGTADSRARLQDARRVYDAVPVSLKRFQEIPATGHEPYVTRYPTLWRDAVRAFLTEAGLATNPSTPTSADPP